LKDVDVWQLTIWKIPAKKLCSIFMPIFVYFDPKKFPKYFVPFSYSPDHLGCWSFGKYRKWTSSDPCPFNYYMLFLWQLYFWCFWLKAL